MQTPSLVLLIIIQYQSAPVPVSGLSRTHFSILEECDVVRDLEALSLWPAEGAKGRAKPITANREKSSQDKNCIPARRDAEENREDAARGPQGFSTEFRYLLDKKPRNYFQVKIYGKLP